MSGCTYFYIDFPFFRRYMDVIWTYREISQMFSCFTYFFQKLCLKFIQRVRACWTFQKIISNNYLLTHSVARNKFSCAPALMQPCAVCRHTPRVWLVWIFCENYMFLSSHYTGKCPKGLTCMNMFDNGLLKGFMSVPAVVCYFYVVYNVTVFPTRFVPSLIHYFVHSLTF